MSEPGVQSDLSPRPGRLDLGPFDIPHPDPFVCDVLIDASKVSRAVPHVSNIEFVRWLDRAAELHSDSLGHTRASLVNAGVMWFVVRHEIDYAAEAWPHDELAVVTWVRTIHRVKSWRDTLIVRPADSTVVCRASTLWVLVDLGTRRPRRIDPDTAMSYAPLVSQQRCTSA